MTDVKIIGRAIPQQFDTCKLGMKGNAPADGELIYEMDEEALAEMRVASERESGEWGESSRMRLRSHNFHK